MNSACSASRQNRCAVVLRLNHLVVQQQLQQPCPHGRQLLLSPHLPVAALSCQFLRDTVTAFLDHTAPCPRQAAQEAFHLLEVYPQAMTVSAHRVQQQRPVDRVVSRMTSHLPLRSVKSLTLRKNFGCLAGKVLITKTQPNHLSINDGAEYLDIFPSRTLMVASSRTEVVVSGSFVKISFRAQDCPVHLSPMKNPRQSRAHFIHSTHRE